MKIFMSRRVFLGYSLLCAASVGATVLTSLRPRANQVVNPSPCDGNLTSRRVEKPKPPAQLLSSTDFDKIAEHQIPYRIVSYDYVDGRWKPNSTKTGYLRPTLSVKGTLEWVYQSDINT